MRFTTVIIPLIAACLCLTLAQGSFDDCCFKYMKEMSHKMQRHVVDYRWQVLDGGCNIPAVIFVMRRGRVLCTDPKQMWVKDLMEKIDIKKTIPHAKPTKRRHSRRPYKG